VVIFLLLSTEIVDAKKKKKDKDGKKVKKSKKPKTTAASVDEVEVSIDGSVDSGASEQSSKKGGKKKSKGKKASTSKKSKKKKGKKAAPIEEEAPPKKSTKSKKAKGKKDKKTDKKKSSKKKSKKSKKTTKSSTPSSEDDKPVVHSGPSTVEFCPSKDCEREPTEIARWECVGDHLFEALGDGEKAEEQFYVEHDCGGVGWGNSIRGLYNAAALAAITGRRLIVTHAPFNRMFDPPTEGMASWDYGISESRRHPMEMREYWDFEKHGRAPGRFEKWASDIATSPESITYRKPILIAGVCGGEREIMLKGDCLNHGLKDFIKCAQNPSDPDGYVGDNVLPVPFFHTLFSRPNTKMATILKSIRNKLELPQLEEGLEPVPGSWALRTPGYYIFALHFRNIPLGFEPLSIDLNKETNLNNRRGILEGFWDFATKYAAEARELAKCRGQELLIYFATDDVASLRPQAQAKLSEFGRVIFGLSDAEVGHMSPQWSRQDEAALAKALKLEDTDALSDLAEQPSMMLDNEGIPIKEIDAVSEEDDTKFSVANVDRSGDSQEAHGNMAMVEWWILANANWLMGHSGTSYSETAAGYGLGPKGNMERMDMVHGKNHASTSFRRDWEGNACTIVGAADKEENKRCPNKRTDGG
jgi:hypothetical protein